eukprot:42169_1
MNVYLLMAIACLLAKSILTVKTITFEAEHISCPYFNYTADIVNGGPYTCHKRIGSTFYNGISKQRGSTSGKRTVHLDEGEFIQWQYVTCTDSQTISITNAIVTYTNDGSADKLNIYVDDKYAGYVITKKHSAAGYYWDVPYDVSLGNVTIFSSIAQHSLKIAFNKTYDKYGVEIDKIELILLEEEITIASKLSLCDGIGDDYFDLYFSINLNDVNDKTFAIQLEQRYRGVAAVIKQALIKTITPTPTPTAYYSAYVYPGGSIKLNQETHTINVSASVEFFWTMEDELVQAMKTDDFINNLQEKFKHYFNDTDLKVNMYYSTIRIDKSCISRMFPITFLFILINVLLSYI